MPREQAGQGRSHCHNGVTLTWRGNKELQLNGISESISFLLLAATVSLAHADSRAGGKGSFSLL